MPIAPQAISTGRLASTRPKPPRAGRQPGFCSRGFGHSVARPTNETASTIAAAHQKITSGTGRSVRTEMPWAMRNTLRSAWLDRQLAHEGLAPGVLGHVALDLEDALDVRLELEGGGLPGLDRLLDVVAVQVDVVLGVRAHDDRDLVALPHLDVLHAPNGLAALDLDPVHRRLSATAVATPTSHRHHDCHHDHRERRHEQPDALVP